MSNKILTFSVAAYNVEDYLGKTLQSIADVAEQLNQIEVLIIDDGSTDRTAQIARQYVERWPDTFTLISKENGGHGSTLNYGIKYARGKYFKMLDGDDWVDTPHMKAFLSFLESSAADLVLTPYKSISMKDDTEEIIMRHSLSEGRLYELESRDAKRIEPVHSHEVTVRTSCLQKNGARILEKCFYTDDEYVFFSCLFSKTVCFYKSTITCYRLGRAGQSVSDESIKRNWLDPSKVVKDIMDRYYLQILKSDENLKELLYSILGRTCQFQCGIFLRLSDQPDTVAQSRIFLNDIRKKACDFADYLEREYWTVSYLKLLLDCRDRGEGEAGIYIWGCGNIGKHTLGFIGGENVLGFIDNDLTKQGKETAGKKVYALEEVTTLTDHADYFIAVKNGAGDIYQQLRSAGIQEEQIIWVHDKALPRDKTF